MAHYAFLNDDGYVTEVITGVDENELLDGKDPETWYGEFRGQRCVRTSYNATIRKNFASIGSRYDDEEDAFIPAQPYASWTFNRGSWEWEPPIPMPERVYDENGDYQAFFWYDFEKTWKPLGYQND